MLKGSSKFLALFLVLLLLITAAAGCSKPADTSDVTDGADGTPVEDEGDASGDTGEAEPGVEPEPEPAYDFGGREIRWSAWWDLTPVAGSSEGTDKLLARLAEMEEKYNFKAAYLNVPWDSYVETFTASTLAGDPFTELAEVDSRWFFPGMVTNGFFYPVSDLGIFDLEEEKWTDTTVDMGTYKGKVYGFATGRLYPRGMFWWNKSMFEREGLPNLYELVNNKQWTWDKMLEVAKKATKDLDGDGIIDQYGIGGINMPYSMIVSNGGELMRMENGKPVFAMTEPASIEALQYYQDLIHVHKVYEIPPDGSPWDYPTQSFIDGKTAMYAYEIWMADDFNENMEDDYGLTLFPMGPRMNEYTSLMPINNLTVMPATVKKPEEVAIFYDARTEPYPDDDPDSWKEGYESFARDAETVESVRIVMEENISKWYPLQSFKELEELSWSFMWAINTANKTPQVAIEEIAPQAQAILEDAFKLNE